MPVAEPLATALLLLTFGGLLASSALFSRAAERSGVPLALVFLGIGVLAGFAGVGGSPLDDFHFAYRIGTAALIVILFDGGLNTPLATVTTVLRPAGMLATVGVLGTAALVAVAGHALGLPPAQAMLLGAIVSSTDAAAVFSVLRASGISLKWRVGTTLEVESGLNDPMAVILTTVLTERALRPGHGESLLLIAGEVVLEIGVGVLVGVALGRGGGELLRRYRLPASGLYPALTLALAFLAYGVATALLGSGFLAVFITGVLLGDRRLPWHGSLLRVHDAVAWLAQIGMFLLLGLLVIPARLLDVWGIGLVLALFLALVARPAVVALCLLPFGYGARDIAYVGWVGLRGAVPVILATYPVLRGAPGATTIFDIVFFVVVVNALIPGSTVPRVTRALDLASEEPPKPPAVLQVESHGELKGELLSFYIDEELPVAGSTIAELPFPDGAAAAMIVRGDELIAPKGGTRLLPGDHIYVLTPHEERGIIHLLFGRPESG